MTNENKIELIPKLRFSEFTGEWEEIPLKEVADPVKRKKETISDNDNVLTISAKNGFVSQEDKWDKIIAGNSLKKYTFLKKDEFSYNRGNSKSFKYGCIYRLKHENALVPNVYHSFSIKEGSKDFFEQYFLGQHIDKHLNKVITSSARMDGLLNISTDNFFNITVTIPKNLKEQSKIGHFLDCIDKKIELLEKRQENLNNYFNTVSTNLFNQKITFYEDYEDWEIKRLQDIGKIITGNTPSTKHDEYYGDKYTWITPSDITYSRFVKKSERMLTDEGLKKSKHVPKGSVLVTCIASIGKNCLTTEISAFNQQINGIIPSNKYDSCFIYYLMEQFSEKLKHQACVTSTAILNKKSFSNMKFKFPKLEEQLKISKCLSNIDDMREANLNMINNAKKYKKSLNQKMFV